MKDNNGGHMVDILLVEDSYHDAELVKWSLGQSVNSSQVLHVKSGIEALDFLYGKGRYESRDTTDTPAIIFLDLNMPGLDGIEVLREIRCNALTAKVPVIILTSSKDKTDIELCYELGANSYIVKPAGFADLCKIIGDVGFYWIMINQSFERA